MFSPFLSRPPLRCIPCSTVAVCPSLPPSLAAWGTDSAADKAAAAAGRAKQYPGAHCSTAYATKHGWWQPKGQAPRDASAGVCVIVWCVCHLYPRPLSILIRSIFFLVLTHGWLKGKSTKVGIFSVNHRLWLELPSQHIWGSATFRNQLFPKCVKCLETKKT